MQVMVKQLLGLVGRFPPLSYLLLDGHFGNNHALPNGADAALYFRYDGPYAGQGCCRVHGQGFNSYNIKSDFVKSVSIKKVSKPESIKHRCCTMEFNFRDAKQYGGLEDFMNVTQTPVTNAANRSLFMVNVSNRLLGDCR